MQGGMLPALILSTAAGLSTTLGSLIALFVRRTDARVLSFSLGFSAGVMILVSFYELLPEARRSLATVFGPRYGGLAAALSLILGLGLAALIDRAVPEPAPRAQSGRAGNRGGARSGVLRVGIVTALAMTLHNFPEGVATFMAGYSNLRLGGAVAVSIAMHNIPEGIAVSVPIYYGTGSRAKAFGVSALSGLSEPVGALAAYLVLAPFLNGATLGAVFGCVAGIMIFLSFGSLIPTAEHGGNGRLTMLGILFGVALMWAALTVFNFMP